MGLRANQQQALEQSARVSRRWIHEGKFLSLREETVQFVDGQKKVWDIVVHPGAVAVVPVREDGKIILIEQFRRAVGVVTLEIPAGLLDPGESVEECAQRELQEEIGYRAEELIRLGAYYSSPGCSTEKVELFVARRLVESRKVADDTEGIDVRPVSKEEARELIVNGKICDSKTVVGVLRVLCFD